MQPDHRRSPVARFAFRLPFRAVCGSIPRSSASWRLAPVLYFLIAAPVFAQGVSAPSNLAASVGDGEVTLTWDEPRDVARIGFEVRYGEDPTALPEAWTDIGWKKQIGTDTVTYTVGGLTNGIEYTFEVRAKAGMVHGDSASAKATPGPDPPDPPRLTVSCPQNQELTIDERIDVQATASGGRPRYRFSMRRAPAGIGIDESTGEITGEPRQTGTFDVTVTVRDADNRSASCGFRITVECPDITVSGLEDVTVDAGEAISLTTSASGGKAPYTYRKKSGPSWVTVNGSSGAIGGSTDTPGTYTVTVGVEDVNDCPDTDGKRTFTITVACPPLSVASIADVEATVGRAISLAARATGGCPPITFAMSGAPSAISINRSTGRISGTPSSTSTSRATVTVRDNRGTTDETRFQLRVSSPLSIVSISDVVVTWQLDMTPIQVSGGRPTHVHSLLDQPIDGAHHRHAHATGQCYRYGHRKRPGPAAG